VLIHDEVERLSELFFPFAIRPTYLQRTQLPTSIDVTLQQTLTEVIRQALVYILITFSGGSK
jgi:hypothetical protein